MGAPIVRPRPRHVPGSRAVRSGAAAGEFSCAHSLDEALSSCLKIERHLGVTPTSPIPFRESHLHSPLTSLIPLRVAVEGHAVDPGADSGGCDAAVGDVGRDRVQLGLRARPWRCDW
jgi:hypothetical protein